MEAAAAENWELRIENSELREEVADANDERLEVRLVGHFATTRIKQHCIN